MTTTSFQKTLSPQLDDFVGLLKRYILCFIWKGRRYEKRQDKFSKVPHDDVLGKLKISYTMPQVLIDDKFFQILLAFSLMRTRIRQFTCARIVHFLQEWVGILRSMSLMRDQLRDLGREIVHQSGVTDPRNKAKLRLPIHIIFFNKYLSLSVKCGYWTEKRNFNLLAIFYCHRGDKTFKHAIWPGIVFHDSILLLKRWKGLDI